MTRAVRWAATRAILNVWLTGRNKVKRQCSQATTFLKKKENRRGIEPRSFRYYQPNALPLGQTGSQISAERCAEIQLAPSVTLT